MNLRSWRESVKGAGIVFVEEAAEVEDGESEEGGAEIEVLRDVARLEEDMAVATEKAPLP